MTEIDTEALGESVDQGVKSLLSGGWEKALMTILFALVILAVCLIVKRIMLKILDRGLDRSHVEKSFHAFIPPTFILAQ